MSELIKKNIKKIHGSLKHLQMSDYREALDLNSTSTQICMCTQSELRIWKLAFDFRNRLCNGIPVSLA